MSGLFWCQTIEGSQIRRPIGRNEITQLHPPYDWCSIQHLSSKQVGRRQSEIIRRPERRGGRWRPGGRGEWLARALYTAVVLTSTVRRSAGKEPLHAILCKSASRGTEGAARCRHVYGWWQIVGFSLSGYSVGETVARVFDCRPLLYRYAVGQSTDEQKQRRLN